MTDAEKLQLRRETCEALGWTIQKSGSLRYTVNPEGESIAECCRAGDDANFYPALESDNGLAMDALVKWCAETGHTFQIGSSIQRNLSVQYFCGFGGDWQVRHTEYAETPAIAICRAICASAKKEAK